MMPVGEDREVLTIAREIESRPCSCQRVREGIGGKARNALLSVGGDGRSGRFHSADGILAGDILLAR